MPGPFEIGRARPRPERRRNRPARPVTKPPTHGQVTMEAPVGASEEGPEVEAITEETMTRRNES